MDLELAMTKYLISDLTKALQWLPLGILFALIFCFVVRLLVRQGNLQKKTKADGIFTALFFAYLFVILCITYFSRESGSSSGFDMRLGSTWGINDRNNAFVLENILLFLPLGMLAPRVYPLYRNLFYCTLAGFLLSTFIEVIQVLTGRGFFQIDDILTNTLGMCLGGLINLVVRGVIALWKRIKNLRG